MRSLQRDFYALNLNERQTNKLITKIETDIAAQLAVLNSKLEPLKEMEQMYFELKQEYDALNVDLEDNKRLLESLVRFESNPTKDKELRLLRTTSNNDQKNKDRQQRNFKWIQMVVDVLEQHDHFMTFDEIFSHIIKHNQTDKQTFGHDSRKINQVRLNTQHNVHRACEECRKNNRGRLIDYNKKIGLFSWVLDDNTPEPKYIKHFMHDKQVVSL